MQTVPEIPTPSKPKAFYATFHGLSGVLVRPDRAILFVEPQSGAVVTITQADAPHLVVLGDVASSTAQYLQDMAVGGYAAQACTRDEGRA